ncbi:MAG: hypothetical protein ACRD8W_13045 [Nitrososphaeraceae archaeon]
MPSGYESIPIPDSGTWMVKMWHFGVDTPSYKEVSICMTWKSSQGVLLREYSRKKQSKLRKERQEYPKMSLGEICRGIVSNSESDAGEISSNVKTKADPPK